MLSDLRYRVRALFRRHALDRELDDELHFHLERQRDKYLAAGVPPNEAARRARLDFGATDAIKEECRDARGLSALDELTRNLRYACRTLGKRRGFTVVAAVTLALGIGANSAVFSALNAVALRSLPFPNADELLVISQYEPGAAQPSAFVSPPRLEDWQRMTQAFQGLSGYYLDDMTETSGEFPERLSRAWVAPRFFEVCGVAPAVGRSFTPDEERFGGPLVVIVSARFWERRFGQETSITGRTLRIGGRFVPIVGVMPSTFTYPNAEVDVWGSSPPDAPYAQNRSATWFTVLGRLRPNASADQGVSDLNRVQRSLGHQYPATDAKLAVRAVPLKMATVGGVTKSLWMLFAAVSLLLLVACSNVAALLIARNAERGREISIRYSLGASRAAVVRQLLTEATLLALIGSALGLSIAIAALEAFRVLGTGLPRMGEVKLDWTLVLYSLVCAFGSAVIFGLSPALRTARSAGRAETVHRRTHTLSTNRLQWTLVGVQVALSVTLLFGAGLFVRSFDRLMHVSPGFDPSRVIAFRITGNWSETVDMAALKRRVLTSLESLRAIPGVVAAATAVSLPGVSFQFDTELRVVEGAADAGRKITARNRFVSSGYFDALAIPMLSGTECDDDAPERTLVINRSFEALYLSGRTARGSHVQEVTSGRTGTIIGVAGDAREQGLNEPPAPTIYWCASAPNPMPVFLVRTQTNDPATMAETIRRTIHQLEPGRAVYELRPLEQRLADTMAENRLRTVLLASFAVSAALLAAVGLYGTLGYIVSIRRREIGVRMAMGARRTTTMLQFLKQGIAVTLLGCAAGLWLSAVLGRGLVGMLYGVTASDPSTFAIVIGLMIAVGALASVWPALRAARIDPIQALREE